jgi:hypothetical protein
VGTLIEVDPIRAPGDVSSARAIASDSRRRLMGGMRIVGSFRDWLNARSVRRMLRSQDFPETLERHYWDGQEYGKDATGLEALGYVPFSRTENEPYVVGTLPAASNGVNSHLDRPVRRRVPSIHVLYHRAVTGGAAAASSSAG